MAASFLHQTDREETKTPASTDIAGNIASISDQPALAAEFSVDNPPNNKEEEVSLLSDMLSAYTLFDDGKVLSLLKKGIKLPNPINCVNGDMEYIDALTLHCTYFLGGANSQSFRYLLTQTDIDLNATCDEFGPCSGNYDSYTLKKASLLHFAVAMRDFDTVKLLCDTGRVNVKSEAILVCDRQSLYDDSDKGCYLYLVSESPRFDNKWKKERDCYVYHRTDTTKELFYINNNKELELVEIFNSTNLAELDEKLTKIMGEARHKYVSAADISASILAYGGHDRDKVCISKVTPFHLAAKNSDAPMMRHLNSMDADVAARDSMGATAQGYFIRIKKARVKGKLECEELEEDKSIAEIETLFKRFHIEAAARRRASSKMRQKKGRRRLLIGEAKFSYAYALVKRHMATKPWFASSITATEYRPEDELKRTPDDKLEKNIGMLKNAGVTVMLGVDGTKIHTNEKLRHNRYKRIHFNFPHDGSRYEKRTLPILIANFFQSAAKLQKLGDKIHMALPDPPAGRYDEDGSYKADRVFYQAYVYKIFEASARAGYVLVKKRHFGTKRYPDYEHVLTREDNSTEVAKYGREFIFEKTNLSYDKILKHGWYQPGRDFSYRGEKSPCLREMSTDNDSSSYEDSSDEDIMGVKTTISDHKKEREGKQSDGELKRYTKSSSSNSSSPPPTTGVPGAAATAVGIASMSATVAATNTSAPNATVVTTAIHTLGQLVSNSMAAITSSRSSTSATPAAAAPAAGAIAPGPDLTMLSPDELQKRHAELNKRKSVLEGLIRRYTAELGEVNRQRQEVSERLPSITDPEMVSSQIESPGL